MAGKLPLPRVHAMVLCDEAELHSGEQGVFTLRGARTEIEAVAFPYTRSRLDVYLQVTGHERTAPCRVVVVRAATDEEVFTTPPLPIQLQGPLAVVPVVFHVRNCRLPAAGLYYVQAYSEQALICERPLFLVEGGVTNGQEG